MDEIEPIHVYVPGCFGAARERGLLDLDRLAAAGARVEWRRSLAVPDEIIAEFS